MVKGVFCSLDAFSTYQFSTVTQNAVHRVPLKKKKEFTSLLLLYLPSHHLPMWNNTRRQQGRGGGGREGEVVREKKGEFSKS